MLTDLITIRNQTSTLRYKLRDCHFLATKQLSLRKRACLDGRVHYGVGPIARWLLPLYVLESIAGYVRKLPLTWAGRWLPRTFRFPLLNVLIAG